MIKISGRATVISRTIRNIQNIKHMQTETEYIPQEHSPRFAGEAEILLETILVLFYLPVRRNFTPEEYSFFLFKISLVLKFLNDNFVAFIS